MSLASIAIATTSRVFGQKEVDQNKLIVLAAPYGSGNSYQLLILEQLSDERPCWSESGANPVIVDPLLLQFDFTGICGRSTDSNGYSVRMAGRDFGLVYDLDVVRREGDLVLIATNITNRKAAVLEVGRTNGIPPSGQFAKINLNSGWRLTKRTQDNKELGHVYLTSDTVPPDINLSAFIDTQSHWARAYIDALAERGIVSGFSEDKTFRPDDPVTRVQFAAMLTKAFSSLPPRRERAGAAFKDVTPNFWGRRAIQTAYEIGFMSGYPDDTFKPNQDISRLEVLVALANGLNYSTTDTGVLSYFQDTAQIPDWASGAIAAATEKKIVVNYPRVQQLNPNRTATRADVAAFIYQALVDAGQLPVIPSPYVAAATPTTPMAPAAPKNPTTPPDAGIPTTPQSPATPVSPEAPLSTPSPQSPYAPGPSAAPVSPTNPGGIVVPTTPVTPQ
ncbi:DUF3747 domain-containing protein [Leptothermofonsia sp. ETS-13]|uniref:DUF3747 domain-containing protein n=1 Tax=Leptothermofonsia sp. ETS-13 TaxID=3035696 RepID=UPI003BA3B5B4